MTAETRQVNGMTVERLEIIRNVARGYSAWEPYDGHTTVTHLATGEKVGRVGTRELPADLNVLPARSDERYDAVTAWHDAQYEEAYAAIVAAFPEAADGARRMGQIDLFLSR